MESKVLDKLKSMGYTELPKDSIVEVGDYIFEYSPPFVNRAYKVSRVTKKFCFVWVNDVAESKYPRIYDQGFKTLPRDTWSTIQYKVFRKRV